MIMSILWRKYHWKMDCFAVATEWLKLKRRAQKQNKWNLSNYLYLVHHTAICQTIYQFLSISAISVASLSLLSPEHCNSFPNIHLYIHSCPAPYILETPQPEWFKIKIWSHCFFCFSLLKICNGFKPWPYVAFVLVSALTSIILNHFAPHSCSFPKIFFSLTLLECHALPNQGLCMCSSFCLADSFSPRFFLGGIT